MNKFISSLAAVAFLAMTVVAGPVFAAGVTVTNALSVTTASTASNHTITFTSTSGIPASGTVKVTFPAGFVFGSVDNTDVDLTDDATDVVIAATPSGTTWGAAVSGQVLTLTNGSAAVGAGSVIVIEIGLNATADVAGNAQITNPVAGNYGIVLTTSAGDLGGVVVPVGGANQVSVSATVDPILTFALGSNTIALGTLSTSAATSASHTMTAATNASSGYVISVGGATLTSGANTIDAYGAAGAASVPGTEGFGINLKANTTPVVGANAVGGSGVAVGNFATVNTFAFDATGPNTIANSATAPSGSTVFTVSYIANIAAATAAGTYGTTLTYTTTPTF